MREMTVRIRFTRHSLGNVPARDKSGRFSLPRSPSGHVTFMATWHKANMRYAATVLGRHQDEVSKICWDIAVDGVPLKDGWFRRFYTTANGRRRYAVHEMFKQGQVVGINCVVPGSITEDDLWQLMQIAGRYRGLSPFRPTEYGLFDVQSVRPRRVPVIPEDENDGVKTQTPDVLDTRQALD